MSPSPSETDVSPNHNDSSQAALDHQLENSVRSRWPALLANSITVIGVAAGAAYTSVKTTDKGVGIAAWVAVAVVGAAASISAARNNRTSA